MNLTGKRVTNNLLESTILLTVTFTPLPGGRATCAGGNAAPGHSAERIREAEDSEAPMDGCSYCYYKKNGKFNMEPKSGQNEVAIWANDIATIFQLLCVFAKGQLPFIVQWFIVCSCSILNQKKRPTGTKFLDLEYSLSIFPQFFGWLDPFWSTIDVAPFLSGQRRFL